jgi:hypothetical protein
VKSHPVSFLLQRLIEKFHVGGCFQDGQGAPTGAGQIGAGEVIGNREKDDPRVLPSAPVVREAPEIKRHGGELPGHLPFLPEKNSFFSLLKITEKSFLRQEISFGKRSFIFLQGSQVLRERERSFLTGPYSPGRSGVD